MGAVAGLSPGELARVRGRLDEFAGEMFDVDASQGSAALG